MVRFTCTPPRRARWWRKQYPMCHRRRARHIRHPTDVWIQLLFKLKLVHCLLFVYTENWTEIFGWCANKQEREREMCIVSHDKLFCSIFSVRWYHMPCSSSRLLAADQSPHTVAAAAVAAACVRSTTNTPVSIINPRQHTFGIVPLWLWQTINTFPHEIAAIKNNKKLNEICIYMRHWKLWPSYADRCAWTVS